MIDPKIDEKVALVTGANSGIGAAIAITLASQGAKVVIHYLDEQSGNSDSTYSIEHSIKGKQAAKEVAQSIVDLDGEAQIIHQDLNDLDGIQELFEFAEREFGPVEVLVNNAAHCELPDSIHETTSGSIKRHFAVNTEAAVLLIKEFRHRLINQELPSGRIVNISTDAAQNFPTQISYGASKAALEAYTRSLAIELGPDNITVNCIAPGPIQTGWIDSELEQELVPSIPLGRIGTPEDIANCVLFLASEQADWITGQIIKVSGGHTI